MTDSSLNTTWNPGAGGFGYGDGDDATLLADMQGSYLTVYSRISFGITPEMDVNRHLQLTVEAAVDVVLSAGVSIRASDGSKGFDRCDGVRSRVHSGSGKWIGGNSFHGASEQILHGRIQRFPHDGFVAETGGCGDRSIGTPRVHHHRHSATGGKVEILWKVEEDERDKRGKEDVCD